VLYYLSMNNAVSTWSGNDEQALKLLRLEFSYRHHVAAARFSGERPKRTDLHQAALARVPGGYAMKLGALLAAAPAGLRARIAEEFAAVLDVETAAKMRGAAAGTRYVVECWINGYRQPDRQVIADERGAQELAAKAESDALAAGAQSVRVSYRLMNGRRAA
jgi:hypothetical protein